MTRHDDSEQRVRAWLDDEARGELPDWVLDQTFTTTRSTPQRRGLRGRLAPIWDRVGSSTRRRSNMFTLATMTAVAATALLAGSVLIDTSPPLTPGAEAPPAITVEEEPFTGGFTWGPPCVDEDGSEIDHCWQQSGVAFTDPRFNGSAHMVANSDYIPKGIYRYQLNITTDEGAWIGDPVPGILTGATGNTGAPSVHLFTGEGAYEGLSAVATVTLEGGAFTLEGYVVHGGFPELPER